jgi:hypothetical protein
MGCGSCGGGQVFAPPSWNVLNERPRGSSKGVIRQSLQVKKGEEVSPPSAVTIDKPVAGISGPATNDSRKPNEE